MKIDQVTVLIWIIDQVHVRDFDNRTAPESKLVDCYNALTWFIAQTSTVSRFLFRGIEKFIAGRWLRTDDHFLCGIAIYNEYMHVFK